MAHHHHHHHAEIPNGEYIGKALVFGIFLNLAFVIAEGAAGIFSGSMGLLSDAGHNLSDTVSLLLAWIAFRLNRRAATRNFTYGLRKSTILVSLANACLLLVAVGMIVVESVRKFYEPSPVDENAIIWVASVGILINFLTALLFLKDRKKDLNIRGAYLHMLLDALVSVGVVISGVAIKFTGWSVIDPIIGLAVAAVIFFSTWSLLVQSLRLSLDGVPEGLDVEKIKAEIKKIDGVNSLHHVHLWAIGTQENALTAHIILNKNSKNEEVKNQIKTILKEFKITHATLETEPEGYECQEKECN